MVELWWWRRQTLPQVCVTRAWHLPLLLSATPRSTVVSLHRCTLHTSKPRHSDPQLFQRMGSNSQVYGDGKILRTKVILTTCSFAVDLPFIPQPPDSELTAWKCVSSVLKNSQTCSLSLLPFPSSLLKLWLELLIWSSVSLNFVFIIFIFFSPCFGFINSLFNHVVFSLILSLTVNAVFFWYFSNPSSFLLFF